MCVCVCVVDFFFSCRCVQWIPFQILCVWLVCGFLFKYCVLGWCVWFLEMLQLFNILPSAKAYVSSFRGAMLMVASYLQVLLPMNDGLDEVFRAECNVSLTLVRVSNPCSFSLATSSSQASYSIIIYLQLLLHFLHLFLFLVHFLIPGLLFYCH
uniref:Uncharacterized protein n=1 Tax=Cacopsylla melanoneura TaxID=428564 RepID=A0A8D8QID0_9HEMI